jgi:hypothetical protein
VTEFRLVGRRFATTDDLRVWLKQTHHFGCGWHRLAVQYAPDRLCDGLLDQRNELGQLLGQTLGLRIGGSLQSHRDLACLGHGGAGQRNEFRISLIYSVFFTWARPDRRWRAWLGRDKRAI